MENLNFFSTVYKKVIHNIVEKNIYNSYDNKTFCGKIIIECGKLKYSYPQFKKKLSTFVENSKMIKK